MPLRTATCTVVMLHYNEKLFVWGVHVLQEC